MTAVSFVQDLFGEVRGYDTQRNGEEQNDDMDRSGWLQKNKEDEREDRAEGTGRKRNVAYKAKCCDVFKDNVEEHPSLPNRRMSYFIPDYRICQ